MDSSFSFSETTTSASSCTGTAKYRPKSLTIGRVSARPPSAAEVAFQILAKRRDAARKTGWSDSLRGGNTPGMAPETNARRGSALPSPANSLTSATSEEMEMDEALKQFRDPKMRAIVARRFSCGDGSRSHTPSPSVTPTSAALQSRGSSGKKKKSQTIRRSSLTSLAAETAGKRGVKASLLSQGARDKRASAVETKTVKVPTLEPEDDVKYDSNEEREQIFAADISSIMPAEGMESRLLESHRSLLQSFRGDETVDVVDFFQTEEFAGESCVCVDPPIEHERLSSIAISDAEPADGHTGITEKDLQEHDASMSTSEKDAPTAPQRPGGPVAAAVREIFSIIDSNRTPACGNAADELQDVASEQVDRLSVGSSITRPSSIQSLSPTSKPIDFGGGKLRTTTIKPVNGEGDAQQHTRIRQKLKLQKTGRKTRLRSTIQSAAILSAIGVGLLLADLLYRGIVRNSSALVMRPNVLTDPCSADALMFSDEERHGTMYAELNCSKGLYNPLKQPLDSLAVLPMSKDSLTTLLEGNNKSPTTGHGRVGQATFGAVLLDLFKATFLRVARILKLFLSKVKSGQKALRSMFRKFTRPLQRANVGKLSDSLAPPKKSRILSIASPPKQPPLLAVPGAANGTSASQM